MFIMQQSLLSVSNAHRKHSSRTGEPPQQVVHTHKNTKNKNINIKNINPMNILVKH